MPLHYSVLVEQITPTTISRITVPDLRLVIHLPLTRSSSGDEQLSGLGIREFIAEKINLFLENNKDKSFNQPKTQDEYDAVVIGRYDYWTRVKVNHEIKRGFFTRFLPILGKASFLVAEIFTTVVSVVAIELAVSGVQNQTMRRFLSVGQSLISSTLGTIMYFYSQSGYALSKWGMKIDNLFSRKSSIQPALSQPRRSGGTSTKIILANTGLTALLLLNVVTNNMSAYEGLDALGERSKKAGSLVPEALFDVAKWILISLGSITTISFVGGYIEQFSEHISRYLSAQTPVSESETPFLVNELTPSLQI